MEFFSRVRRIRTANSVQENGTESIFANNCELTVSPTFARRAEIKFVSGEPTSTNGIKAINKSRKVYKLNANKSNCSSTSSSDLCNTSCNSQSSGNLNATEVGLENGPKKIPVCKADSNTSTGSGDSGIDSSGKRKVGQQDSNSSTGSIISGPVNLQSELERRCHEAARLAYKEEAREAKQLLKQQLRKTENYDETTTVFIDVTESNTKSTNVRRAAIDCDPRPTKTDKNVESPSEKNFKKKKKKKTAQSPHPPNNPSADLIESECSELSESDDEDSCLDQSKSDDEEFADDEHDGSGIDDFDSGNTSGSASTSEKDLASGPSSDRDSAKADDKTKPVSDDINLVKPIPCTPKSSKTVNKIKTEVQKTKQLNNKYYPTTKPLLINGNPVKNENYAHPSKHGNLIKVGPSKQIQPTSRRVSGVTLRDLYSLRAVLSDSDNGTVFSGRRRIDNAAVAIKRIMKNKVKRWHMIKDKSVPMEIALLRKVNETRHPGVVTLLEWFECSDCFLLVMARPTPVLDLFDFVSEKKRLDESTSKMIFVQVVEAMYHCHSRSVLHRDIKLENILVKTDTLISTIIDFGCGTHLNSNLYKDFAGTPQYYPPEYYICKQYHGLPAAVWSCGVMLYAMLCGRLPFASAHEIVHLEPSWHGSFCRKISPLAKELVEAMLKKQPRRRLNINDVLKHKWLRNIKYDSATGEISIYNDDKSLLTTSSTIMFDMDKAKVANASIPLLS